MSLSESLYLTLPDQTFRLAKLKELDLFLAKEAEDRRRVQKKYLRAINIAHVASIGAGVVSLALEGTGLPLMLTGVGIIPGAILSGLGICTFAISLLSDAIIRRCTKKAMKHAEIARCATDKFNSIHKKVSQGLRDANISVEEFDRILEEEEQYQRTKEEIRNKARTADLAALKKRARREGKARRDGRVCEVNGHFQFSVNWVCGIMPPADYPPPAYMARMPATTPPLY